MQTMKERDDEIRLGDYVQIDDAYWGGVRSSVRGRGAKGKRPVVAAVSLNDEGNPIRMRFSAVCGFNKVEITNWAKAHLMPKSLVISAGLACFRAVKDAEMFEQFIVSSIRTAPIPQHLLKLA